MELVSLKRNLLAFNVKATTIKDLVAKIQEMKGFSSLRNDIELTLYCCNVVESIVSKDHKLDKKKIVLEVFNEAFGLTHEEQTLVSNQIDFLCSISKVKSLGTVQTIGKKIYSWFERKIL
jgi:hypothetical protein